MLQAGRLPEAEDQFKRALQRAPANGWSYYGLSQLYKARGNAAATSQAEAQLAKTWVGDRTIAPHLNTRFQHMVLDLGRGEVAKIHFTKALCT
jgi:hypothetical protein